MARVDRWRSYPVLGTVLSVAAMAVPFALSIAAAVTVGSALPHRHGLADQSLWWAAVLASSTVTFVGAERLCRRVLPLAALLKMTMLFPDRAPKRLKVAWRAGLTRDLERRAQAEVGAPGPRPSVPSSVAEEILALAASLGRHDRRTRGHSERVRAFTDMIADELHLPQADRDRLRWSALLHDVGKLAVHPHVLNKEGKLSEDEWEEIRAHPLEGRRLIAPLAAWLGPWSLTIEQHHESYDGSGYPFGLSGEELSLGARIVSVADSFEVMTAARSYKKPMSAVAARQELTRCAGSQFDPAIVRAFLNVSIGRLRWTIGPVSWVADVPFLTRLGMAGHAVAAGAQVALGATALTVGGALAAHAAAATPPHSPSSAVHGRLALAPTTTAPTTTAPTTTAPSTRLPTTTASAAAGTTMAPGRRFRTATTEPPPTTTPRGRPATKSPVTTDLTGPTSAVAAANPGPALSTTTAAPAGPGATTITASAPTTASPTTAPPTTAPPTTAPPTTAPPTTAPPTTAPPTTAPPTTAPPTTAPPTTAPPTTTRPRPPAPRPPAPRPPAPRPPGRLGHWPRR